MKVVAVICKWKALFCKTTDIWYEEKAVVCQKTALLCHEIDRVHKEKALLSKYYALSNAMCKVYCAKRKLFCVKGKVHRAQIIHFLQAGRLDIRERIIKNTVF